MEQFILSNLNQEGQKLQVPSLRLPYAVNYDSNNFTLLSGLNQNKVSKETQENNDPMQSNIRQKQMFEYTQIK